MADSLLRKSPLKATIACWLSKCGARIIKLVRTQCYILKETISAADNLLWGKQLLLQKLRNRISKIEPFTNVEDYPISNISICARQKNLRRILPTLLNPERTGKTWGLILWFVNVYSTYCHSSKQSTLSLRESYRRVRLAENNSPMIIRWNLWMYILPSAVTSHQLQLLCTNLT